MTALITSNFYSDYTADFALLGNLLSKIKPNKIVSTDEGLNLLRNRVITKPKTANKLGETLQNIFRKKEKVTAKPYSLRSAALDDPTQRKIITSVNNKLKETPTVSKFTPTVTTSKNINPKAKLFSSISEARKANVKKAKNYIQGKKEARKIVKDNPIRIKSQTPPKINNITRGLNQRQATTQFPYFTENLNTRKKK